MYFTPSCLPQGALRVAYYLFKTLHVCVTEYGGNLPRLQDLDDPLRKDRTLPNGLGPPQFTDSPTSVSSKPIPVLPTCISPTSPQNPFFGYPTLCHHSQTIPSFQPSQRRLRDLFLTLAKMWWKRWRIHVSVLLWLVLAVGSARIWIRRGSMVRGLVRCKGFWMTGLG